MNKKPSRPTLDFSALGRVIKMLYQFYPRLLPLVGVCIITAAAVASIPAIFTQKVLAILTDCLDKGILSWEVARERILPLVLVPVQQVLPEVPVLKLLQLELLVRPVPERLQEHSPFPPDMTFR